MISRRGFLAGIAATPVIASTSSFGFNLNEQASLFDFGATGLGGDDSEAFRAACSSGKKVLVPPAPSGSWVISGTFNVVGTLYGVEKPRIKLRIEDPRQRGFVIASGGCIRGVAVERTLFNLRPANGSFANAICVNEYISSGQLSENWAIEDVDIDCINLGNYSANAISVCSNSANGIIRNCKVSGDFLISCLLHWGPVKRKGKVIETCHPRNIHIENFSAIDGNINKSYGIYLSGSHDVQVRNHSVSGVRNGFTAAVGDYGGRNPAAPSQSRIMKGISVSHLKVERCLGRSLRVSGSSDKVEGERWFSSDAIGDLDLKFEHIFLKRDQGQRGAAVQLDHVAGVSVKNLEVVDPADSAAKGPRQLLVTACSDVSISGRSNVHSPLDLRSGFKIAIEVETPGGLIDRGSQQLNDAGNITRSVPFSLLEPAKAGQEYLVMAKMVADVFPGVRWTCGNLSSTFLASGLAGDKTARVRVPPLSQDLPADSVIEVHLPTGR